MPVEWGAVPIVLAVVVTLVGSYIAIAKFFYDIGYGRRHDEIAELVRVREELANVRNELKEVRVQLDLSEARIVRMVLQSSAGSSGSKPRGAGALTHIDDETVLDEAERRRR